MPIWVGLVVAGFAGLLGLVFLGLGISERRRLAEVVDKPTTRIDVVESGRVEVAGTVLEDHAFPAPVTRRPAVYAEVFIEHGSPEIKRGKVEIVRGETLVVDDGSGRAAVSLVDAEIEIEMDEYRLYRDADEAEPPETVLALLRAEGRDVSKVLSWSERRIEPGAPLVVLGRAAVRPTSDTPNEPRVLFAASPGEPLLISVGTEAEARASLRFGATMAFGLAAAIFAFAAVVVVVTLAWAA